MDLKQLEYFVRIAELGSYTRASDTLAVAQPALSRQIRLLEVELRQHLFVRNGRGVVTTEAGKLLLEHARGVLHQVDRAREELGLIRGALAGRVAVGLPPTLSKILTVPLSRAFQARMPEARLSISEGFSVTMKDSLIAGRLDIALLYNTTNVPGIDTQVLLEEELFLVGPGDRKLGRKPIKLADIAEKPLVIPTRPHAIRMLVETELANIGCRPTIALEIDSVAAILDLVLDGAGFAVLSSNAVTISGNMSAFSVRPITAPQLHSKLSVAVSSQRPTTLTQQAMLALVRRIAKTHLKSR